MPKVDSTADSLSSKGSTGSDPDNTVSSTPSPQKDVAKELSEKQLASIARREKLAELAADRKVIAADRKVIAENIKDLTAQAAAIRKEQFNIIDGKPTPTDKISGGGFAANEDARRAEKKACCVVL